MKWTRVISAGCPDGSEAELSVYMCTVVCVNTLSSVFFS